MADQENDPHCNYPHKGFSRSGVCNHHLPGNGEQQHFNHGFRRVLYQHFNKLNPYNQS